MSTAAFGIVVGTFGSLRTGRGERRCWYAFPANGGHKEEER